MSCRVAPSRMGFNKNSNSLLMRKIIFACCLISTVSLSQSKFSVKYNPAIQPTGNMQYFKPTGNSFVGDCIPSLSEEFSNVAKTAGFANGRRIAAAWIPSRKDDKDNAREIFGGNAVFRELIQHEDGTLGTKFPPEMIPATGASLNLNIQYNSMTSHDNGHYSINAPSGVGAACFSIG